MHTTNDRRLKKLIVIGDRLLIKQHVRMKEQQVTSTCHIRRTGKRNSTAGAKDSPKGSLTLVDYV